ncbi:hypothetical protein CALCODRAFT_546724 [Calocera cornea HHB12733]|uniref:Uncharacterized protein n=1 Tax=Calocera cornea HHB12733 TaxID=1353952 RepID=A0A165EJY2_9BASI|nr:hypothetical protein CALCODRAFT_546724 [Calocera cornea HHB12733]
MSTMATGDFLEEMPAHRAVSILSSLIDILSSYPTPICNPTFADRTTDSQALRVSKALGLLLCYGNTEVEKRKIPAITIGGFSSTSPPPSIVRDLSVTPFPAASDQSLRQYTIAHGVTPASPPLDLGTTVVICRNPSMDHQKPGSMDGRGIDWKLQSGIRIGTQYCREASFDQYLSNLISLLQLPTIEPLQTLASTLHQWATFPTDTILPTTPAYTVELGVSVSQAIQALAEKNAKVFNSMVPWGSILNNARPYQAGNAVLHQGLFHPQNAPVWACFLAHLLSAISLAADQIDDYDGVPRPFAVKSKGKPPTTTLPDRPFEDIMQELSVCLEVLSSFFYGNVNDVSGSIGLAGVLHRLLGDRRFGLVLYLDEQINPAFRPNPNSSSHPLNPSLPLSSPSDSAAAAQASSTDDDEDTSAVEDAQSAYQDAENDDTLNSEVGSLVKATLINLCGFFLATHQLLAIFNPPPQSESAPWRPKFFSISGSNIPGVILTHSELESLRTWLASRDFSSRQVQGPRIKSFLKYASTTGLFCNFHCEGILMAVIRNAKNGTPEVKKVPGLWNTFMTAAPMALSTLMELTASALRRSCLGSASLPSDYSPD